MAKRKIEFLLKGTDQNVSGLLVRIAERTERVEKELGKVARTSKKATTTMTSGFASTVGGVVGTTAAIGFLTAGLRETVAQAEKAVAKIDDIGNASKSLQFLGQNFKEGSKVVFETQILAAQTGVPGVEVAKAREAIQSQAFGASPEFLKQVLNEVLELRRTTSGVTAEDLVPLFTKAVTITGETDANKIQNIVAQFVEKSASTVANATEALPTAFAAGGAVGPGQSAAKSAAALAALTQVTKNPRVAAEALDQVGRALADIDSSKDRKLLAKRAGFTGDDTLNEVLKKISAGLESGDVTQKLVIKALGAPATRILPLLKDRGKLSLFEDQFSEDIIGADKDITGSKLGFKLSNDVDFSLGEQRRQSKERGALKLLIDSRKAQVQDLAISESENLLQSQNGLERFTIRRGRDLLQLLGASPETLLKGAVTSDNPEGVAALERVRNAQAAVDKGQQGFDKLAEVIAANNELLKINNELMAQEVAGPPAPTQGTLGQSE